MCKTYLSPIPFDTTPIQCYPHSTVSLITIKVVTMAESYTPLIKYYKYFTLLHGGLTIVAMIVSTFLYELNGSFSWVILFCSSMAIAQLFTMDHKRLPNAHEKHRLIWGFLGITFIISCVLAALLSVLVLYLDYGWDNAGLVLNELLQQANTDAGMVFFFAILLGLVIALILSYLTLWVTFTFTIKSFLKRELKGMAKAKQQSA